MDDLHCEGILQVVHMRDYPITWSTNIYNIKSGSQVYDSFLEEFLVSYGDTVDDGTAFHLYTDGQSERTIQTL